MSLVISLKKKKKKKKKSVVLGRGGGCTEAAVQMFQSKFHAILFVC